MEKIIISVVGKDRPGIVAAISNALFELDCNIENISQTIQQSIFAAIFTVSGPEELTDERFTAALKEATRRLSLDIMAKRFSVESLRETVQDDSAPFVITTMGPDKKGLVAAITQIIADYGGNITNLQAVFKGGEDPMGNMMIYAVSIPKTVCLSSLYRDLEAKASELDLEINIQHERIFEAMNRV